MKKEVIILGDIELGGGTLTDDFVSDRALVTLISSLTKKKMNIDLVLNGDTFDFLKCPYINNKEIKTYPRHITEDISLAKLKLIYKAHHQVFNAWKKFVRKKGNNIFFIFGNHDHDLFFKEVQHEIKKLLGMNHKNVFFKMFYNENKIYAEHGHQYDFLNKVSMKQAFLKYKSKPILNISWIALGLISNFMILKEEHPFLERVRPLPRLFSHHKLVAKKISWRTLRYFFMSIVYYPIRYFYDPTYTFPRALFNEFYRRMKDQHWDVDKIVDKFKKKHKRTLAKNKIYVLSHIHEKYIEEKEGWVIIHPDTWRDEYILKEDTKELVPKIKSYVKIVVWKDELEWKVVNHSISRKILHFDHVQHNEHGFIELVKNEEGYRA